MLINSFTDEGKKIGIKIDNSSDTLSLFLSYLFTTISFTSNSLYHQASYYKQRNPGLASRLNFPSLIFALGESWQLGKVMATWR